MINSLDQLIKVRVPQFSVLVVEITSHRDQDVVGPIAFGDFISVCKELLQLWARYMEQLC